jgi:hypothetical protein
MNTSSGHNSIVGVRIHLKHPPTSGGAAIDVTISPSINRLFQYAEARSRAGPLGRVREGDTVDTHPTSNRRATSMRASTRLAVDAVDVVRNGIRVCGTAFARDETGGPTCGSALSFR